MFSMPDDAIFFTRNVVSFFLFILGFGVMAWVIQTMLLNYTRWWQVLALIGQGPSKGDMSRTDNIYNRFLNAMQARDPGNNQVDLEGVG